MKVVKKKSARGNPGGSVFVLVAVLESYRLKRAAKTLPPACTLAI
jgi:hypothetical protein